MINNVVEEVAACSCLGTFVTVVVVVVVVLRLGLARGRMTPAQTGTRRIFEDQVALLSDSYHLMKSINARYDM